MANAVKEVLQSALEAFGPNGEFWVQGGKCSDKLYNSVNKCAALAIVEQPVSQKVLQPAKIALCTVIGIDVLELYGWNDAPERTWPEVKELFEKAIAAA